MSTLPLFESMHALSIGMVEAARANAWEQLAALEEEMAHLRHEAMRLDAQQDPAAAPLSPEDARHKAELISQMLENDREVRTHVEPWLESTRKLLSAGVRDRAVRAAYGAFES
jgi:flagellar protein FliT